MEDLVAQGLDLGLVKGFIARYVLVSSGVSCNEGPFTDNMPIFVESLIATEFVDSSQQGLATDAGQGVLDPGQLVRYFTVCPKVSKQTYRASTLALRLTCLSMGRWPFSGETDVSRILESKTSQQMKRSQVQVGTKVNIELRVAGGGGEGSQFVAVVGETSGEGPGAHRGEEWGMEGHTIQHAAPPRQCRR